jgi:hypothetical protein
MILLMKLGFEYEEVIQALNSANNNVEYAAVVLMNFVNEGFSTLTCLNDLFIFKA